MDFPQDEIALKLSPPDLAGFVLTRAVHLWKSNAQKPVAYWQMLPPTSTESEALRLAYAEAWNWLLREGLLLPDQNPWLIGPTENVVPSRRAREITDLKSYEALRKSKLLPRDLVDPRILIRVETSYFLGQYDEAVSLAFREVEITLRGAGGFPDDLVGVDLIRDTLSPKQGTLRPTDRPDAEADSVYHLFRGAHGMYRNSTAHRVVGLGPEMAVELFVLASHLLRIVDGLREPEGARGSRSHPLQPIEILASQDNPVTEK